MILAGRLQLFKHVHKTSLPQSVVQPLRMAARYDSEQLLRVLGQRVLKEEVCSQPWPQSYSCINIPSEWVSALAVDIQSLNFSTAAH